MRKLAAALVLFSGIASSSGAQPWLCIERSAPAMGTTYTVDIYGRDKAVMQAAAERALEEAGRIDRMLSNYRPESELTRVNEHAAEEPVKISQELFDLLTTCVEYSRASQGAFDITVAPLMKVWGFYKDSGRLPDRAEVRAALGLIGYRNVELNPAARTVRFARHGVSLDPGGVGKGYAVDKMVGVLKKSGIACALVSGGGSSIYGMGAPPDSPQGWYVRIRDPKDEKKTAAEVYLRDQSISTSGSYEKFFWADGKLYSHIMDPRTGFPAEGMLAVSVIAPKTLDSEVWAKPYYILGRDWAREHKPRAFQALLCEDKQGAACAWVR